MRHRRSAVLEEVVTSFELLGFWTDHAKDETRDRDDVDPLGLFDLIRIHAGDCGDPTTFLERWDEKADEERKHADIAKDDLGREDSATDDRVVIGTMHSSKGREYDSVVLYDYGASLGQLDADQVEEERRVFYVGMTRGKTAVLLTIDTNKDLHQFVRESIRPADASEPSTIKARREGLDARERDAVVALRKANEALEEIMSGRASPRWLPNTTFRTCGVEVSRNASIRRPWSSKRWVSGTSSLDVDARPLAWPRA